MNTHHRRRQQEDGHNLTTINHPQPGNLSDEKLENMNKLLFEINPGTLRELGFVEENDGTGDPRGVDWN